MNVGVSNRRLLKLAAFLEKVPRKRFDYDKWVGNDWAGMPDLSCGTTACALGWATTMPEFRRLGLRLAKDIYNGAAVMGPNSTIDELNDPYSAPNMCFVAGGDIFGLTLEESMWLFQPREDEHNATAKQVARKIRKFVANRVVKEKP